VRVRVSSLILTLFAVAGVTAADEIKVAVASNFSAARVLAGGFEQATGHQVTLVFGSTGKHYTQILNGAPFDVFLAADALHPTRLENGGRGVAGSRFTYAVGSLALWSLDEGLVDSEGRALLDGRFRHLAIAHPRLAPYGAAAREVLTAMGLWEPLGSRLVRGENVAQAFQFVASGNAELGFVALSQVERGGRAIVDGSFWKVPTELHQPIEQQALLLRNRDVARGFLRFLRSDEARAIIRQYGYTTPD
jgi:molybdate transport system substrate-binding protein